MNCRCHTVLSVVPCLQDSSGGQGRGQHVEGPGEVGPQQNGKHRPHEGELLFPQSPLHHFWTPGVSSGQRVTFLTRRKVLCDSSCCGFYYWFNADEGLVFFAFAHWSTVMCFRNKLWLVCVACRANSANSASQSWLSSFFVFLSRKDLRQALRSSSKYKISDEELRKYTMDMLTCLQLLKNNGIVHSDLKPVGTSWLKKFNLKLFPGLKKKPLSF